MTSNSWEAALVEGALRPDTGTDIVFVDDVLRSGTGIGTKFVEDLVTSKNCWLDWVRFGRTTFLAIDLQISQILRKIRA